VAAAKQQSWDASVQMLVVFADVLNRLSQDIRWTRDLGKAFLAARSFSAPRSMPMPSAPHFNPRFDGGATRGFGGVHNFGGAPGGGAVLAEAIVSVAAEATATGKGIQVSNALARFKKWALQARSLQSRRLLASL
jgi:hypothetical protein